MKYIKHHNNPPAAEHERGADRFVIKLPIEISGIHGFTRNVSATGIYFETSVTKEPGSHVYLTVKWSVRGEQLTLGCEGEVVRIERNNGKLGIAAKLSASFFSDAVDVIEVDPASRPDTH